MSAADLLSSDCTSCAVKQDKSAYWTPPLYFLHQNGSAEILQQSGGMLSYYLMYTNPGEKLHEFPQGFRMVAGDQFRRNFTCQIPEPPKSSWSGHEISEDALSQKALGFNCLNYQRASLPPTDPNYKADEPSLYRHYLPNKTFIDTECPDGLRLEIFFPSCWNGKDTDSPDHRSHMAYPSLIQGGDCPPGYPTRVPSIFYETIWETGAFKDFVGQFALSNGDPTGYGYHGDFMAGWQQGFLQKVVDDPVCGNSAGSGDVQSCSLFDIADDSTMQQCTFPKPPQLQGSNDECTDQGKGLPGNNPLQSGPQPATLASAAGPTDSAKASSSLVQGITSTSGTSMPQPTFTEASASSIPGVEQPAFANAVNSSSTAASSAGPTAAAVGVSLPVYSPLPSAPLVTSAVQYASSAASPSIVSTTWSTDGNTIWAVDIQEVTSTVTATDTEPSSDKLRRHLHEHRHHHFHAGHRQA